MRGFAGFVVKRWRFFESACLVSVLPIFGVWVRCGNWFERWLGALEELGSVWECICDRLRLLL